jgi:hypothetical protein
MINGRVLKATVNLDSLLPHMPSRLSILPLTSTLAREELQLRIKDIPRTNGKPINVLT